MTNPLQRIKLGMLLFGSIFGAILGVRDLSIALLETEPTRYDAARFTAEYGDQQWLEIHGVLALDHVGVRPSSHSAHRGKNLAYAHVPVVSSDWGGDEPVAVIATFGPVPYDAPLDWSSLCPDEACVSGQVRTAPLQDLDVLFPDVPIVEEPVVINVGTDPGAPIASGAFTAFMILVALACGVALRNEHLERSAA